ncbi:HD-GYP domain-containing protein [Peribacillus cavernae]|uniref:HD-GYP domain-containing protein n=1 Tax=Peribacillus cavernae TaxID=1674310 RepID=A0A433HCD4_9BACI|nr:HD-GYP domain-containing protein [Peribacillus cavernae]MDQ0219667.1 HD-GYP domain-containing protein (c-di-GMP phosphodiesterase class II) [Peribacillus cavernae]RUQ25947.1 HD-GYP domain-containing protein [Peribacillus cavernae]
MRLLPTDSLIPGVRLGKSIKNERGHILLYEGVKLSERMILRLKELNIPFVYIHDPKTKHINPGKSISERLRKEAIKTIEDTFSDLQNKDFLSNSLVIEKASRRFTGLIRDILIEIRGNQELLTLLADIYTYDNYIFTHSFNVTLYSLAIGTELKLKPKQMETLGLGAILHDVGKILVPVDILMKPGKLTEEEFTEIKKHSETGFQIIRNVHTVPLLVAHCAYQHHERLDGSGYPRGLAGDDIHYFGKIIAVADVFDAVTSNRVYRSALLPHEGLEILYAGSGIQFDRKVVEAFRRAVAIYPNGLGVKLNDGRKGIVSRQNRGCSDRPVIEILEENGQPIADTYEVDLEIYTHLLIADCDTANSKINQ